MITSRSNPLIREIRLLRQAKHRRARGEFLVEGVRLVEEAIESGQPLRRIVHSPRLEASPRGAALLAEGRRRVSGVEWHSVSDAVLDSLSDTQTHQGILAVLGTRDYGWEDLGKRQGLVLLLHGLQDPGNLGTIFRTAEAGRSAGLVLTRGTIDPYNPKAVRGSMGSLFRLPFLVGQEPLACLDRLRTLGRRVFAAAAGRGRCLWEVDLVAPAAVLFGQEGSGLPEELLQAADGILTIPMQPGVNSLNVAVSASLVVYEAARQRFFRDLKGRGSSSAPPPPG